MQTKYQILSSDNFFLKKKGDTFYRSEAKNWNYKISKTNPFAIYGNYYTYPHGKENVKKKKEI